MTTVYSVLLCWIYLHTAGSVLIATLVHGAINPFQGVFLGGVDPAKQYWQPIVKVRNDQDPGVRDLAVCR